MIIRKPYAFFIKMFKPIHLILAILVAYLIYLENKTLNFLNTYINSSMGIGLQNVKNNLLIYLIPIIIIILSLIILGVMFRKKKPSAFYLINIFAFVIVLIINLYTTNFLNVIQNSVVSIRIVKLIHDLVFINIIIGSISFVFFIIRGMGVNIKKFDFDSEISKFDISESDKEEIELDINVDLNESKRKRRKFRRNIKYTYIENKFLFNITFVLFIIISFLSAFIIVSMLNRTNKEGVIYSSGTFNFKVNRTIVLNTSYKGEKLTDNYLVVVDTSIASNLSNKSLFLNDFSLKINDFVFKPTTNYSNSLLDIGNVYNGYNLSNEFTNYLFVYEIPSEYMNSNMYFRYSNTGEIISIKLSPKELVSNDFSISEKLGEEIDFGESIGNIKFKINDFELKNKFILEYNYCYKKNDCLLSKEYLKPSINTNFDKYVLRLNVDYNDSSDLNTGGFYELLSKFGSIYYYVNDTWNIQNGSFEEIKSNKVNTKNDIYIGVNSSINDATSIKLVFNIRGSKYEYVLK